LLNLLNSVEIIVDTEEPESISLNIEVLDFVHSSNHCEWRSTNFSNVVVRTNESLGQVSGGVSLDQDQHSTDGSQKELDVSETGADETRNSDSEVAVDDDNQVRHHVNQRPRHTNHIHIVEIELDFDGSDGLDDGVDDGDQHKEEHDKVHVANSEIFFLETNLRAFVLLTFSFLFGGFEREFSLSLRNLSRDNTSDTVEVCVPKIGGGQLSVPHVLDSEAWWREQKQHVSEAVVDEESDGELQRDTRHGPKTEENGPRRNQLEEGNRNRGAEVVVSARRVKDSLRHGQTRLHKRELVQENLQVTLAPSRTLLEDFDNFVRRLSDGQDFVVIRHSPTHSTETERQKSIFSEATDGEVTDILERISSDGEIGTATVDGRPLIERRFDTMEEGNVQMVPDIFVRVDIVEKLRRLDETDWSSSLFGEDGQHSPEVISSRHEISIEDNDGFTFSSSVVVDVMQRVVDVSSFGVVRDSGQLGPSNVVQVDVLFSSSREDVFFQMLSTTVVEHVDVNVQTGADVHVDDFVNSSSNDFERFFVRGDHDTDCMEFWPFKSGETRFGARYPAPQGQTLNQQRRTRDNFQTSNDSTVDSIQTRSIEGKRDSDVDISKQRDDVHGVQRLVNVVLVFLVDSRDRNRSFRSRHIVVEVVFKVRKVFNIVGLTASRDSIGADDWLAGNELVMLLRWRLGLHSEVGILAHRALVTRDSLPSTTVRVGLDLVDSIRIQ